MRKSSLGRRSSTQIPVRVGSIGGASGQKLCSGGGKTTSTSKLRQPGFSSQRPRSQSEDRDSYEIISRPTLRRSSSMCSGRGGMTPITPRQSLHANLPTGSARPPRHQTLSTGERNGRMSSIGGSKNSRKDTRPLTDKLFQQAALAKVQQYFDEHGSDIIAPGTQIRPMNVRLFVDMMEFLLKKFDSRIIITKTNYLDELPNLLRKFGYRSKVDRSWLLTVNTPHSWPHVVGVLSWLVDIVECINAIDPLESLFPNNIKEDFDTEQNEEEEEQIIPIDKELVLHLKKTYRINSDIVDTDPQLDAMDEMYIEKRIVELKCTHDDLEILQRELDLINENVENEIQRENFQVESLEKLRARYNALKSDFTTMEKFVEDANEYINISKTKLENMKKEIEVKRSVLQKKQDEYQHLQKKINCQLISMEERERMVQEKHELHSTIQFYESSIREYETSAFSVDLKLAEDQRKLEKLILDYNKIVAEKIIVEPRLKDVEVKYTVLSKIDDDSEDAIDSKLCSLRDELKNSIKSLESKKEKLDNNIRMVKQDIRDTEDKITKETILFEGIECDYEKQKEGVEKETKNLKDELKRCQEKTKQIRQEMSQYDPTKHEEKIAELERVKHDYELLKKKCKLIFQDVLPTCEEVTVRLEESDQELMQAYEEAKQNLSGD